MIDYAYDRNSALTARKVFIEVLQNIRRAGIDCVHILAHSMGNLLALEALAYIRMSPTRSEYRK